MAQDGAMTFFGLPPELRDMVYEFYVGNAPIRLRRKINHSNPDNTKIIRRRDGQPRRFSAVLAHPHIAYELLDFVYANGTFVMRLCVLDELLDGHRQCLKRIRNIKMDIPYMIEDRMLEALPIYLGEASALKKVILDQSKVCQRLTQDYLHEVKERNLFLGPFLDGHIPPHLIAALVQKLKPLIVGCKSTKGSEAAKELIAFHGNPGSGDEKAIKEMEQVIAQLVDEEGG